jgi:hypothetical protein
MLLKIYVYGYINQRRFGWTKASIDFALLRGGSSRQRLQRRWPPACAAHGSREGSCVLRRMVASLGPAGNQVEGGGRGQPQISTQAIAI